MLQELVRWEEERDIKARREPAINSPVIPVAEDDVDDKSITQLAAAINKNKKTKERDL